MFQVINNAAAGLEFRELLRQATAVGVKELFSESAAQMARDLASDPLSLGESRDPEAVGGFKKRFAFYPDMRSIRGTSGRKACSDHLGDPQRLVSAFSDIVEIDLFV